MSSAPPVAAAAFAPLGLLEHRTGRAVVGRPTELAAGGRFPTHDPRTVTVKGISDPMEVVTVDWR